MKMSALIGERYKEWPSEAQLKSHGLLIRGGYIRQVGAGIYSLLTPAKRVAAKIEKIIRQEMDRIDGQEVLFPVVLPRELWDEALDQAPDSAWQIDRFLAAKLRGRAPEEAEKRRLTSALLRRGFAWGDVREAWSRLGAEILEE